MTLGRLGCALSALAVIVLGASAAAQPALEFDFPATDTPLAIPPGAPDETFGTTTSYIPAIQTLPGAVSDVNVFVNLDHAATGDLDIFVEHEGQQVHLFNQLGLLGADIRDVLFDDEAATPISAGSPPFGPGAFQPEPGVLADLDGMSLAGEWSLIVVDNFLFDTGTLLDFHIQGLVDPFFIPAQSNPVAQAAADTINSIIPDQFFFPDPSFAQIVGFFPGAGAAEAEFALRSLAQDEAFAPADLSLRQLGWQHRSVRDRLRSARGAGMGMGPAQLAAATSAEPVAAGPHGDVERAAASYLMGPAWEASRFGVWLSGRGVFGDSDLSSREAGYGFEGGLGAGGADVRIAEGFLAGVSVGGGSVNANFDGKGGSLASNAVSVTLYGQARPLDRLYLDVMGSYAWNWFDSRRHVVVGDFAASPAADFDGGTFGFDGYAFYELEWAMATFGPALALSYLNTSVDSYTESSGDVADLRVGSDGAESLQTWLGGEAYLDFGAEESFQIMPHLFLYWVHEYLDDVRTVTGRLPAFPTGTPISLQSESPDRDYMELAAGVAASIGDRSRVWVRYETTLFRSNWTENQVTAGLAVRF